MMAVNSEPQLLEIVGALAAPGRLAGRLHGRQKQADERADDGDHHQKLDQRETTGRVPISAHRTNVTHHAKSSQAKPASAVTDTAEP